MSSIKHMKPSFEQDIEFRQKIVLSTRAFIFPIEIRYISQKYEQKEKFLLLLYEILYFEQLVLNRHISISWANSMYFEK